MYFLGILTRALTLFHFYRSKSFGQQTNSHYVKHIRLKWAVLSKD
jgi:hypothetical protein